MDTLGLLATQPSQPIVSRYDPEADVLYLSAGDPEPAVGVDIGDGLVLRYNPDTQTVTGITVIGLQSRLQAELAS